MMNIHIVLFDIDGVITNGKLYICDDEEIKTTCIKDLDAIGMLREAGYIVGCISGEDTAFSRKFASMIPLDCVYLGCKDKREALGEISEEFGISFDEVCYIGDGKYDIPVLEQVGLGLCPADAISEAKCVADFVLSRNGGDGCIAECYTLLMKLSNPRSGQCNIIFADGLIRERIAEHRAVVDELVADAGLCHRIGEATEMISESYQNGGSLFLCGNGGSAADAQHLAAEMVGRFYLERPALRAEALTVNTSVLTALSNDYDFNMIFARQLEARARKGDVLIGITTSGASANIQLAFQRAKKMGVQTILMTGAIRNTADVLPYTDCLLDVPSKDTPRIQEMHILIGHIICEAVEKAAVAVIKKETL